MSCRHVLPVSLRWNSSLLRHSVVEPVKRCGGTAGNRAEEDDRPREASAASFCRGRELFPPVFLKLQEQDLLEPVAPRARVANPTYRISQNGDRLMARDTADFAQQSSERAMQAANFGMTWGREFAEESFNQSRQAVDSFLRVARKMAEDFETQAIATRE